MILACTLTKTISTPGLEVVIDQSIGCGDFVLTSSPRLDDRTLLHRFLFFDRHPFSKNESDHAIDGVEEVVYLQSLRMRRCHILELQMRTIFILEANVPEETLLFD